MVIPFFAITILSISSNKDLFMHCIALKKSHDQLKKKIVLNLGSKFLLLSMKSGPDIIALLILLSGDVEQNPGPNNTGKVNGVYLYLKKHLNYNALQQFEIGVYILYVRDRETDGIQVDY